MTSDELKKQFEGWGDLVAAIGIPWFRREDYEALRELFVDRDNVFDTYDEWLAAAEPKERELLATGRLVVRITVEPKAFADWCRAKSMQADGRARSLYASQRAAT